MQIIISSVNFKAGAALEAFVREKVSKLFNQSDKIIRADVMLREAEQGSPENKLCEIRLVIPGNDHFVRRSSAAYENSVLQAVGVLQKILSREKSRVIKRRHALLPVM